MTEPQPWTIMVLQPGPTGQLVASSHHELTNPEAGELRADMRLIHELLSFREFEQAIGVAQRWTETVERAECALKDRGNVSPLTAAALSLDLRALAKAANECDRRIRERLGRLTPTKPEVQEQFEARRSAIVATTEYLVVQGLAADAADGPLELSLQGGSAHFAGTKTISASNLGTALLGRLAGLVFASLEAFEDELRRAADNIERHITDLPFGAPQLAQLIPDDDSGSMKAHLADIPVDEVAAVRRFLAALPSISNAAQLEEESFALMGAHTRGYVKIGGVDVSAAAEAGTTSEGLDAVPSATALIDLDLVGSAVVDYWSSISMEKARGSFRTTLFDGAIKAAIGQDQAGARVELSCEGVVDMTEHNLGGILVANMDPIELTQSLLRQSGLPEDSIKFRALIESTAAPDPAIELFDVLIPIEGITTKAPVLLGRITVSPAAEFADVLAGFPDADERTSELRAAFSAAPCFAVATVEERLVDKAEEAGMLLIETTVAWLASRERYGYPRQPDGALSEFSRELALNPPRTLAAVVVAGRDSRRQWMRWTSGGATPADRGLPVPVRPPLPDDLKPREQRSLLAIHRASTTQQMDSQLQALWEALESYASRSKPPKMFTQDQLDSLRASTPEWMNDKQTMKFAAAVGQMNEAPLLTKLRHRLDQDAVPLSDVEQELIFGKLRKARNNIAHGRQVKEALTRSEMLLAISLVARIVLTGMHAARAASP